MLISAGLAIKAAIIGASLIVGVFSSQYFGNDNPIEEYAEQIIEQQSGINVDLSPNSPEQHADEDHGQQDEPRKEQ